MRVAVKIFVRGLVIIIIIIIIIIVVVLLLQTRLSNLCSE